MPPRNRRVSRRGRLQPLDRDVLRANDGVDGTACTGSDLCNQTYACTAGVCAGSNPVACPAATDDCHVAGTCNPSTGTCSAQTVVPDGTGCTGTDKCNQRYACQTGTCTGSNPVTCTASDQCHVAGTCDPTSGSCSNPAASNGTSCNDDNACTQGDACQSGTCSGTAVACAPLDACHVAGTCNPSTGSCTNPAAPDGTSCGSSGDGGASLVCSAGACGAPQTTCASYQTLCKGVCENTQNDPKNCGSCGNVCPAKYSCVAGSCQSPQIMASCGLPSGSLSVLVAPDGVTAYVPNGNWGGGPTGIQRLVVEGGNAQPANIPTHDIVNSCASNWVTGETICTTNGQNVYTLTGTTITNVIASGATGQQGFSGGFCANCGAAVDPIANKAILEIGVTQSGTATGGFQFLDFATNALETPIPLPINHLGEGYFTSEDVAVDPVRQIILSPVEDYGQFQIVRYGSSPGVYTSAPFPPISPTGNPPDFDSAAEDCTTGIALATSENTYDYVPNATQLTLVDSHPGDLHAWISLGHLDGSLQRAAADRPSRGHSGDDGHRRGPRIPPGAHHGGVRGSDGHRLRAAVDLGQRHAPAGRLGSVHPCPHGGLVGRGL